MAISYEEVTASLAERVQKYVDDLEKIIDTQMKSSYFGGTFSFRGFERGFLTTPIVEEIKACYSKAGWYVVVGCNLDVLIFSKGRPLGFPE